MSSESASSESASSESDAQLIARCLAGEESAWALLAHRYADLVYGTARRCGCTDDEAGDVVQEVFLALLKYLSRLRKAERILAWILTSARRESWRTVRRRRAATRRERAEARPESAEDLLPPEALTQLEEEQAVRLAFRELNERCRRLLDALFFATETRPYAEIAKDLGLPIGSIGPTRARCLEALRRELGAQGFALPDVSGDERGPHGGEGSAP